MMSVSIRRQFFGVLKKYGIDDDLRRELVYTHTGKRSSAELDDREATNILASLLRCYKGKEQAKCEALRKQILAIGISDLGWSFKDTKQWCEEHSREKKAFNAYTAEELIRLRETLRKVVKFYMKKA